MTWAFRRLGGSNEGRPVEAWVAGRQTGRQRVLIVGGQHGDERRASRAVDRLRAAGPQAHPCDLAIVPALNPDGLAGHRRGNAQGLDLNRDHLLLEAPETRALHAFIRDWAPHVIIDVHNFPSRRAVLLSSGMTLGWHVCVDVATHPAVTADHSVVDRVTAALTAHGLRSSRYTLVRPDRLTRHSSPHAHDLRNAAALRHEVTTVLIEGRAPTRDDDSQERRRLRQALDLAIETVIAWAAKRLAPVEPRPPQPGERVPVGWRWRGTDRPARLAVWNRDAHREAALLVPRYAASAAPRRWVQLPGAYAVPMSAQAIVALIGRQHLQTRLHSDATEPWLLVPTAQRGGRALAVLLEPRSRSGLVRLEQFRPEAKRVWRLATEEGSPA